MAVVLPNKKEMYMSFNRWLTIAVQVFMIASVIAVYIVLYKTKEK
jgi:hypothetical protein